MLPIFRFLSSSFFCVYKLPLFESRITVIELWWHCGGCATFFYSFYFLSEFGETYGKVLRRTGHSCFIDDVYCDASSNMLDPFPSESVGLSGLPGFVRFSFCRLLQNQTRTTSFSIHKLSAKLVISWLVGLELMKKAFSKATRTDVSIEVRFFRLRPMASGVVKGLLKVLGPNILCTKKGKSLFFK